MIIDRHLVRQVAIPSVMVSVILSVIFVGYSLSRFLIKADAGLLNTDEVVHLTLLKVLIALEVLLPIGLFFGLMLGLGKLHSDSEIVAMQASGISEFRILRPILTLAIPLALLIAALSLYARPWAFAQSYSMLAVAEASSDIDRIKAGQFYLTRREAPDSTAAPGDNGQSGASEADRERAIFIEKISPQQALSEVFIRTRTGDEIQIISSASGLLIERPESRYHTLELDNARVFKRVVDGPDLYARIDNFTIKVKNQQPEQPAYKAKAVASAELASSSYPKDRAEYQWRLSTPITTVLLALLAVPLSRSKPRQGRYAKLLLAFVIYAAYYNLIGISGTWVERQTTDSIWWVPLSLALLVVLSYLPWHSLRSAISRMRS
ncbi:MAG: LptF/LptG family permease [Pseudomonadales bacterium]|nr:LptF/LptG family permease [Halioglobus sp.]MCP5128084.1 LptF/LptG family permease [Pseudomonadales bacterium]